MSRFAIKMTTKSEEFIISSAKLSAKDVTKTSSFYTDILGLESLNAGTFKLSGTTCIEISQLDSDSAMMGDVSEADSFCITSFIYYMDLHD